MSIETSVIVQPSKFLRRCCMLMCAVVAAAALQMVFVHRQGKLSLPYSGLCAVMAGLVVLAWRRSCSAQFCYRIEISAAGKIRLTCLASSQAKSSAAGHLPVVCAAESIDASLLAYSTIWPGLLLLRFATLVQPLVVVPVFRDCVSEAAFRELTVACRWIAAHNH